MALKISLKPNERMIVGGAVVRNAGNTAYRLIIENKVPVLRQRDIMGEAEADTLRRRLYFTIQLIYIDQQRPEPHLTAYWQIVRRLLTEDPQLLPTVDRISHEILAGRYYQALKLARELVKMEQEEA
jgi:flagellar protein FlbT